MKGRLLGVAVLATAVLAGCGGSSQPPADDARTPHASGPGMEMGMTSVAATTRGDVKVGLDAMAPETFYVAVGGRQRKHAPTAEDTAHMMVTLSDAKSGIRLPDAAVTLRLTGPDGQTAYDGPLYPMIGRGMGMHYGENVPLGAAGDYTARLVASPPRIGRHADAAGAWAKPVRLEQRFGWDGETVTPRS